MKVSVLMMTFNHERFIAQALDSVVSQEAPFPYEIVVGDDCSTDQTRRIILDYQARCPGIIRLLLAEKNQGITANFQRCFEACRGQYIAVLDGDDYWTHPRKLQRQVDAMDRHPSWALCFHRARYFSEENHFVPEIIPGQRLADGVQLSHLLFGNPIPSCAVMYRRGVVRQFPDGFDTWPLEDWPTHILHALQGDIGFLDEVMGAYRSHGNGVWSSQTDHSRLWALYRTHTLLRPIVEQATGSKQAMLTGQVRRFYVSMDSRCTALARRYAWNLFQSEPLRVYNWPLLLWSCLGPSWGRWLDLRPWAARRRSRTARTGSGRAERENLSLGTRTGREESETFAGG